MVATSLDRKNRANTQEITEVSVRNNCEVVRSAEIEGIVVETIRLTALDVIASRTLARWILSNLVILNEGRTVIKDMIVEVELEIAERKV